VFRVPGYTYEDLHQEKALARLTAPVGCDGLAVQRNLIDLLRTATGRQAALNTATVLEDFMHPSSDDGPRLEAREVARDVAALPRRYAAPLVLLAAGFSYREIAAREGCTPKQVDNRVAEGRRRLTSADVERCLLDSANTFGCAPRGNREDARRQASGGVQ